jgi:hypothetical protein
VYSSDTAVFKSFEWIGTVPRLQRHHHFPQKSTTEWEKQDFSPKGLLKYISSMGLEAYKTLATALQTLLTSPVSVAPCERSFSKIELIKSYLRSTVSQDRFTNLVNLSIEKEVASSIDFSDVIKAFSAIKSRKVHF